MYIECEFTAPANGEKVFAQIQRYMDAARERVAIEMECAMLGLSRRHVAQRFRRWKEKAGF